MIGVESCLHCDPSQGATSVTVKLTKEGQEFSSEEECVGSLNGFEQFQKVMQDNGMAGELHCERTSQSGH